MPSRVKTKICNLCCRQSNMVYKLCLVTHSTRCHSGVRSDSRAAMDLDSDVPWHSCLQYTNLSFIELSLESAASLLPGPPPRLLHHITRLQKPPYMAWHIRFLYRYFVLVRFIVFSVVVVLYFF